MRDLSAVGYFVSETIRSRSIGYIQGGLRPFAAVAVGSPRKNEKPTFRAE